MYEPSRSAPTLIEQFNNFLLETIEVVSASQNTCNFCNSNNRNFSYKNDFTAEHSKVLGASAGKKGVPNSFWNSDDSSSLKICDFCSFVILCHHLALTTLQDKSEIFINAPSFKVMYHLNKFVRDIYTKQEAKDIRQLLGMSVIEYATKIQATLGVWTGMNIEVVSKHRGEIEFFSLPYEIIRILSDREIASLLSSIGEFKVLNLILEGNFSKLTNDAYSLLRIGLKPYKEWNKSQKDFIKYYLKLDKNRRNPNRVAEKMFKLYSLLEQNQKREVVV